MELADRTHRNGNRALARALRPELTFPPEKVTEEERQRRNAAVMARLCEVAQEVPR